MRWPWNRPKPQPTPPADDTAEASEARRRAEQALRQDRARSGEVRRVADQSRRHRRVNHFAELIDETFRGTHQ